MKLGELDLLSKYLEGYDLSLQSINLQPHFMVFKFWDGEAVINLVINTNKAKPSVALLGGNEFKAKSKSLVKPIVTYFDKHFKTEPVKNIFRKKQWGRVLIIEVNDLKKIEIQLVPHNFNVLLSDDKKVIAFNKPKELPPIEESPSEFENLRSLPEMADQVFPVNKPKKNKESPEELLKKKIKKLEKTISKVELSLKDKENSKYKEAAMALSAGSPLSNDLSLFIDNHNPQKLNGRELIDYLFEKGKQNKLKVPVVQQKIIELNNELEGLRERLENKDFKEVKKAYQKPTLLKSSGLKGRTFHLSEGFIVVRGKSAAENLQLLRKSPAWFLWLHVKDAPGSHALIHRNKKESVSDAILLEACHWLLKESIKSPTGKYDVVVTEKRYVKPIKGDKLGRVTYSKERIFCVTIES